MIFHFGLLVDGHSYGEKLGSNIIDSVQGLKVLKTSKYEEHIALVRNPKLETILLNE